MTEVFLAFAALGVFGLGTCAGLLAALFGLARLAPPRGHLFAGIGALAAVSVALLVAGAAKSAAHPAVAADSTSPRSAEPSGPGANAGSMEAATAALAARLAAQGGMDKDWELLAQSYDFLGRSAEAQQARQHKASLQGSLQESVTNSLRLLRGTQPRSSGTMAAASGDRPSADLLQQAEEHRRKREFQQACATYRVVIAAGGMTADSWADYADALASANPAGSLRGEPGRAIEQALALDPRHAKALWLKASLAHEEHRYQEALATWRRLLALMPAGSSDARIIQANIAEATRLATARS